MGLIISGGWVMMVLLGLSVVSLAIIIQKAYVLNSTKISANYIHSIKANLSTRSKQDVIKELQYSRHVAGQIAAKSIEQHESSKDVLQAEINHVTRKDMDELLSKMNVLSIIVTAAPVLGLLGTVLGLMDVFSVIAVDGSVNVELLSGGISKALVTTVAGLSLSVPTSFIHQFLDSKIDERLNEWENIPTQLLLALNKQI